MQSFLNKTILSINLPVDANVAEIKFIYLFIDLKFLFKYFISFPQSIIFIILPSEARTAEISKSYAIFLNIKQYVSMNYIINCIKLVGLDVY